MEANHCPSVPLTQNYGHVILRTPYLSNWLDLEIRASPERGILAKK